MHNQNAEQQFNRAQISVYDLEECIGYLSSISDGLNRAQKQGLLVAGIVAYCRPFCNSSKNENATRKMSFRESKLTPEQKELHRKIIRLRNSVVAHSDYEIRPVRRVNLPAKIPKETKLEPLKLPRRGYSVLYISISTILETICITEFLNLAQTTYSICREVLWGSFHQAQEIPNK